MVVQRQRDLQRPRGAHLAVVAAAGGDRVHMGPDDDRKGCRVGAVAPAHEVARQVDRCFQAALFHHPASVGAASQILVAVGEPRRAAAIGPAEAPEGAEDGVEAVAVHVRGLRGGRKRAQTSRQRRREDRGGLQEVAPGLRASGA